MEDSLCRENSAAATKVLPFCANLAAPLNSQSYAKPDFAGLQNCRDGKHPDVHIKDFRALVHNTQDAIHHMAIFTATQEFIKRKSCNMPHILDEQQHAIELCIYHCINVQVKGLEGERMSQMCSCIECQSGRGGDRRNDSVWAKQCPGCCYCAVKWCLLWQLKWLFKIKLLNEYGAFVEYWLALVHTIISESSGYLDSVLKFVQVRNAPVPVP